MKKNIVTDMVSRTEFKKVAKNLIGLYPLEDQSYYEVFGAKPTSSWTSRYMDAGGRFTNYEFGWEDGFSHADAAVLERFGVSPEIAAEYEQSPYSQVAFFPSAYYTNEIESFFEGSVISSASELYSVIEMIWSYYANKIAA